MPTSSAQSSALQHGSATASPPLSAAPPPGEGSSPGASAEHGVPQLPSGGLRWRLVLSSALPMALGYLPIGFAFAALAHLAGAPPWAVLALSASVYACSSQIVAVQLWAAGQSLTTILATTVVINLRHILMSSVIAPYVRRLGRGQLGLFCFHLCDEAFALHVASWRTQPMSRAEIFAANGVLYVGWLLGNSLAFALGLDVAALQRVGLDFAPMGMFLGLLAMLVRDLPSLTLASGCALSAVGLRLLGLGATSIVLTAVGGASVAMGVQQWKKRR